MIWLSGWALIAVSILKLKRCNIEALCVAASSVFSKMNKEGDAGFLLNSCSFRTILIKFSATEGIPVVVVVVVCVLVGDLACGNVEGAANTMYSRVP